jgi:hypothetical protein
MPKYIGQEHCSRFFGRTTTVSIGSIWLAIWQCTVDKGTVLTYLPKVERAGIPEVKVHLPFFVLTPSPVNASDVLINRQRARANSTCSYFDNGCQNV